MDKGIVHAIRQLHHLAVDKKSLVETYDNNFDVDACWKGADFVPFKGDELASLRAFWELLEAPAEGVAQGETTVVDVEVAEFSKTISVPLMSITPTKPPPKCR